MPITASNHIDYVGGQTNARLLNFKAYADPILSMDGRSARPTLAPRVSRSIRPSGARVKVGSTAGANRSGLQAYKGMSSNELHMKNNHLYKGKFRGRGTYMTHMAIDWRKLTL